MSYQIPAVFQNDSNYDCHFIIKELVKLFDGKFQCFVEYTEKSKTFSVPIEKEVTEIDEDGNESVITISQYVTIYITILQYK